MSPVSSTAPPGPSTRRTSDDSFSAPSIPMCVLGPAGASTRSSRSPTTACWPARGAWTGTPASCAAASAAASAGGAEPDRGRSHSAATSVAARTAGAPPVWSVSACVRTSRSSDEDPSLRSQAAARPSRPVSTSTEVVVVDSRNASPCPTSMAVSTKGPPTDGGVGSTHTTQQAAATTAAGREPLVPRRPTAHTIAARTPTRSTGSPTPTSGPHHCSRRAASRTTWSAGRANRRHRSASVGAGTASTAAVVHSTEAAAAAGTATRFAGTVDRATAPPLTSRIGMTATCAPSVTASRSSRRRDRTTRTSGSRRTRTRGATSSTPTVAPADSSSPSRRASSGSSRTRTRTAPARLCSAGTRRPRAAASRTRSAIALARSTDGSARVRSAKRQITATAVRRRPRAPSPATPASIQAPATTNATLEPETAVRWVRPVARIASSSAAGRRLVSPVTRPVARPAGPGGRAASARRARADRTCVVAATMAPGPSTRSRRDRTRRTPTCRLRRQGSVARRTSAVPR